jgi:tetratricopeptide (TPR) repeat protein
MQKTQKAARPGKAKRSLSEPAQKTSLWPATGFNRHLRVVLGLGLLVLLTFSNTLHNTEFALDNKFIIQDDPRLREANRENLQLIFREDYWWPKAVSGLYRPLTTLSYMFNYAVLGNADHAAGYHWINFLLHWLNAVLVYFMALVLMETLWPAVFIAAVFATHPIVTESVSNIVGRADLFATATIVGGFLCYAKSTTLEGWRKAPWLAALMVVTTIGEFCKESAVAVLGVMVLYDFTYRLQRRHPNWLISLAANFWQFTIKGYVVLLPAFAALAWVRSSVFGRLRPPEFPFVDNPLVSVAYEHLGKYYNFSLVGWLTAIKVIGRYLWLLIWPQKLSCDYSYDQVPLVDLGFRRPEDWQAILAVAVLLVLAVITLRQYRRNKPLFFFITFFFLTLFPTSNLTIVTGSIMAERFLYLPSIGFAGCAVIAVYALCQRFVRQSNATDRFSPPVTAGCLLGVMVLACGVRAYDRNFDWENDVVLWTQASEVCPDSFKSHKSLAYALYEREQQQNPPYPGIDRLVEVGEKARAVMDKKALPPAHRASIVYLHLGAYYRIKGDLVAEGDPDGAKVWYQKSVESLQGAVVADQAFNETNRRKELARGRALDVIPDVGNHEVYANLALSYTRLGQLQDALNAYLQMRHLAPTNPNTYLNIALIHLAAGHTEEAVITLVQTLLIDNGQQEALNSLVDIYRQNDPDGCAILMNEGKPRLNADCAIVRKHLCLACYGMAQVFHEAKQFDLVRQMKQTAQNYRCPPEGFQQLTNPSTTQSTSP